MFLEVCNVTPTYRNHGLRIFSYGQISPWASPRLSDVLMALGFLSGGYNLHRFSDAIDLVSVCYSPILGSAITK